MYKILDFIRWALTKAKRGSIPKSARLLLPVAECGTEPWEYLFGSVRVVTNQATLDRYFNEHYYKSLTREQFDSYTQNWSRKGYATDCQGLLDAYITYECGEKFDWNADMNYKYACDASTRGAISDIDRPYVVGEALYMKKSETGRMSHIGWVCGFLPNGEPLVVEARGIAYGVIVTKFSDRPWKYRALMNLKFDYSEQAELYPRAEPIVLSVTNPTIQGDAILSLQQALNGLNYTDADGKRLTEDGKCGQRTMQAVRAFANAHAVITEPAPAPEPVEVPVLPPVVGRIDLESAGIAVCAFRVDDLPVSGKNEVKRT
ncbi:MAG: hypothetical protein IKZ82_10485 [Clostridia bacterium]|nr:hypothetical protein [Clostridia bacterium]